MRSISTRPISKSLLSISTAWISPAVCTGKAKDSSKTPCRRSWSRKCEENLLQASSGEVNIAILFNEGVITTLQAEDDSDEALVKLYEEIISQEPGGGTNIYLAASEAYRICMDYDLEDYTPAVILMTDGQSSDYSMKFERGLPEYGFIIPIFSITFGDADPEQLEGLAELTDGRVFDGTEDLTAAFRSVKGYN